MPSEICQKVASLHLSTALSVFSHKSKWGFLNGIAIHVSLVKIDWHTGAISNLKKNPMLHWLILLGVGG